MVVPRRVPRLSLLVLLGASVGLTSPLVQSCTPAKGASSADAEAQAAAGIDARLRGAWVLQSFVPDTPLEPMLASLLEYQFGRLTIRLDGTRVMAASPGIEVNRAYRVSEVRGDQFKLTTFDDQGVAYDSVCMFLPDGKIEIHSITSPWRGVGLAGRAGP